jgi:hypothetical protein
MKTILASAVALGLMTSAAMAAPAKLTYAQMDSVKAGQVNISTGCLVSLGLGVLGVGNSVCTASSGSR